MDGNVTCLKPLCECSGCQPRGLLSGRPGKVEGLNIQLLEGGGIIEREGVEPAPPSLKNENSLLQVVIRILEARI